MNKIIVIPKKKFEVYPEDLKGEFKHEKAIEACKSLKGDWRLPTIKELLEMNDYKEGLEIKDLLYWSSNEFNSNAAWAYKFNNSFSTTSHKGNTYRVRPVRTIKT